MAQYQSSFEDADYDCGEVSRVTGEFTIEPISISHLPTDPTIARLTLSYTNKLTLSNVKYSTTTDQDVSAWMVLQSKVEALVSTDKTFVPRQDCTTTTNELSGQVEIAIKKDTSIQVGARWSGFDDNPDGLALPTLEWMELPLSDDFTLTPPQNLQVTFPDHPEGKIEATLESWSKNPNIGGVPVEGETWNWRVETVDENGDIIGVKEFNENSLTPTLFADTSKVKPNRAYQLKVIACNEYLLETAVISPTIYSLPPEPIIRRVTFYKTEDGKYTAVIDWAKPRSGGGYDEFVRLDVPGFVDDLEIAQIKNGASQTGSIEVPGLDPATAFVVRLSNTSLAGQRAVEQRFFTPSEVPTFKVDWDEPHKCVTVTAEAPNISEFELALGYYQGDESLGTTTGNTISACDLVHGEGQILYASAVPKLPDHTYTEATGFLTTPILNPILGVSKNCNVSLNIVDIVESKQGVVTKKWQTGERVKVVEPCPVSGGGFNPWRFKPVACTDQYGQPTDVLRGSVGFNGRATVTFRVVTTDNRWPVSLDKAQFYNGGYIVTIIDKNHFSLASDFSGSTSFNIGVKPAGDDFGEQYLIMSSSSVNTGGHKMSCWLSTSSTITSIITYFDDIQPDDDTWNWG